MLLIAAMLCIAELQQKYPHCCKPWRNTLAMALIFLTVNAIFGAYAETTFTDVLPIALTLLCLSIFWYAYYWQLYRLPRKHPHYGIYLIIPAFTMWLLPILVATKLIQWLQ